MTRRMRSPASDSRSGRISGMPPATDASNSRSTPAVSAASNSSSPKLASSSLFAVTTGLPAFSAARIRLRAGSTPPIISTMTSTSGSATTRLGVVGEHAVGELDVAFLGEVAAPRRAPTSMRTPDPPRDQVGVRRRAAGRARRRRCRSPRMPTRTVSHVLSVAQLTIRRAIRVPDGRLEASRSGSLGSGCVEPDEVVVGLRGAPRGGRRRPARRPRPGAGTLL